MPLPSRKPHEAFIDHRRSPPHVNWLWIDPLPANHAPASRLLLGRSILGHVDCEKRQANAMDRAKYLARGPCGAPQSLGRTCMPACMDLGRAYYGPNLFRDLLFLGLILIFFRTESEYFFLTMIIPQGVPSPLKHMGGEELKNKQKKKKTRRGRGASGSFWTFSLRKNVLVWQENTGCSAQRKKKKKTNSEQYW